MRADHHNAEHIVRALDDFGFASLGLIPSDFDRPDQVVQLGVPPVRIDLITSISGMTWIEADANAVGGTYGAVPVRYIGRNEIIRNKRATGRHKDLSDLEALGEDVPPARTQ